LLYRDANGGEAAVEVPAEGVFLGRGNDCAVRTDDAMVSRKNCRISLQGGRWVAEDLGSSNGTFVNGVRIQKQVLTHADVVRCGTLQVRFVESAAPAARAAQPEAAPKVDPLAVVAERDQRLRESNEARDRLRGEMETLRAHATELETKNAVLERENQSLQAEVVQQMRASDKLRLELENVREAAHGRIANLEEELRQATAELRARIELDSGQGLGGPTAPVPAVTSPMPAVSGTTAGMVSVGAVLGASTKPFPSVVVEPPAPMPPAATIPEMPAINILEVAVNAAEHALTELRASLTVARSLVAEPGVVVPATSRAVVVAMENAQRRADEALDKLRTLRESR
jgi:hypothetical protein